MANNNNYNKRHVGKIANTDQRCIVAWMQIPNREDHALCIPTDGLPPRMEQAVMQVLESAEGQAEEVLANILSRRKMPDSPNNTLFEALHAGRHMVAVPVSQVVMFPRPNMPFPLVDILRSMGKLVQNVTPEEIKAREKFNTHAHNKAAMTAEQRIGVARGLLVEAELLEAEVKQKRARAYDLAPELEPKTVEFINIVETPVEPESQEQLDLPFTDESDVISPTSTDFLDYFSITKPNDF
jgi:hypothetical protein